MPPIERLLAMRAAYAGRFDVDGRRLYFVSDLAGVPQVWALIPGQRWPELVYAPPDRAQAIHPGPKRGTLVAATDVGGNERSQLTLVGEGRPTSLTDEPDRVHHFGAWSPDGRRISYSANRRDQRWFDVYVRDLASGETRCVLEHDATNQAGEFSPDGRFLLVTRVFSTAHQELWLVDLSGGGAPRLLTAQKARYAQAGWLGPDRLVCLSDLGRDMDAPAVIDVATGELRFLVEPELEVDSLAASPDGRLLAYALNHDGALEIRVRDLAAGGEKEAAGPGARGGPARASEASPSGFASPSPGGPSVEHVVEGLGEGALYEYWQRGLAWDPKGERLAISWHGATENQDVWVHDVRARRTRQVTHAPRAGVSPRRLVAPEHVAYPTFDGRSIPALYFPPARRGGSPPCVVVVHGGPEGQSRPAFNPVVQAFTGAGFAVLAPNVRGSSGYGKKYQHLDDVRKRMDSVTDLAHAAYWLRDTGRADPKGIAVYGGSYGGFMVLAALAAYPDLWAAGVDLVGIANFVTFLEHTGPWRRHLREAEYGSLENDREFLESISPLNHVERITAPLLVIHGANDPRVPVVEAEQIVERLRSLGRIVEFIRFDDEGHQIAKLRNRLVAYPAALEFLRKHVRPARRQRRSLPASS